MAARPVSPEDYRAQAVAAARGGDLAGARAIMERGLAEHPGNAALANSAGNLAMQAGAAEDAAAMFARAAGAEPASLEYATNHAIALSRLERHTQAVAALRPLSAAGMADRRYCSVRAAAERAAGNLAEAQVLYDRALALEPGNARALHGRARVAVERGQADAVARFEAALAANRGEADLWLGLAQSLDAAGERSRAQEIAEQLVAQAPHWLDALRFLAQLRLAAGETDFTAPYAEAERRVPGDPAIPFAHAEVLAGLDHAVAAAEVAAAARRRFPENGALALLEAVHRGSAGQDDLAEAIWTTLADASATRFLHEARHRIRLHQIDRAGNLLDRASQGTPWSVEVWALRGIVWRMAGDDRANWLHGQDGLMQMRPLPGREQVLDAARPLLHRLHDGSPLPLGQSLRGGTQTRGRLFDRAEGELRALHDALWAAAEDYRAGLPPADATHPLLRHRDEPWRITGSWSVRLSHGGDHHTSHIHPQGLLSSALYVQLPELGVDEGLLELGRPAPDLRLDLGPLAQITPREGHLALFPSTLYHGTTPFGEGTRMTVAFDVQAN